MTIDWRLSHGGPGTNLRLGAVLTGALMVAQVEILYRILHRRPHVRKYLKDRGGVMFISIYIKN